MFDHLEKLGINESVKNERRMIFFSFPIRVTGTCTCRVSAVAVKLITFQCVPMSTNFKMYRIFSNLIRTLFTVSEG